MELATTGVSSIVLIMKELFHIVVFSLIAVILSCFSMACGDSRKTKEPLNDGMTETLPKVIDSSDNGDSKCPTYKQSHYEEIIHKTPNVDVKRTNRVEGVILHHTAEPTIERSLGVLTSLKKRVGTHVVIDKDGTRYIMAKPEVVTYHAGFSILNGKEDCNGFTIGIEFQGNTLEEPLTQDQMLSAAEYLKPIMEKYNITLENIVTHEMVRVAYKKKYPGKRCRGKVDITQTEYFRFMKVLKNILSDN